MFKLTEAQIKAKLEYIISVRTDVNEWDLVQTKAYHEKKQCMGFKFKNDKYELCNAGIYNCYFLKLKSEFVEKYRWQQDDFFVVGFDHLRHMVGKEGIKKFKETALPEDNELMKRSEKNKETFNSGGTGGRSDSIADHDFKGTMEQAKIDYRKRQNRIAYHQPRKQIWHNSMHYDPRDNAIGDKLRKERE